MTNDNLDLFTFTPCKNDHMLIFCEILRQRFPKTETVSRMSMAGKGLKKLCSGVFALFFWNLKHYAVNWVFQHFKTKIRVGIWKLDIYKCPKRISSGRNLFLLFGYRNYVKIKETNKDVSRQMRAAKYKPLQFFTVFT